MCKACATMHTTLPSHIGIVEDDPEIIDVLTILLESNGFSAIAFPPEPIALDRIAQAPPDLLILDLRMPHLSGVALFRQLRSNPITSGIPVIFFTASEVDLIRECPDYTRMGAHLVIKPDAMALPPL